MKRSVSPFAGRISTYTVQDHLKAIFNKVGVTSCGELAHHLALQFS